MLPSWSHIYVDESSRSLDYVHRNCIYFLFYRIKAEAKPVPHPLLGRFAVEDLEGIIAWRDLHLGRRALNTLLSHAPKMSRFQEAKKQLQKTHWSSFKPFVGQSQGVDPQKGIYLLWDKHKDIRLIITHRAGRAHEALREVSAMISQSDHLNWRLRLSDDQQSPQTDTNTETTPKLSARNPHYVDPKSNELNCKRQKELLVCDSRTFKVASVPLLAQ